MNGLVDILVLFGGAAILYGVVKWYSRISNDPDDKNGQVNVGVKNPNEKQDHDLAAQIRETIKRLSGK